MIGDHVSMFFTLCCYILTICCLFLVVGNFFVCSGWTIFTCIDTFFSVFNITVALISQLCCLFPRHGHLLELALILVLVRLIDVFVCVNDAWVFAGCGQ